eukprot:755505-Rhodomonas_salina.1
MRRDTALHHMLDGILDLQDPDDENSDWPSAASMQSGLARTSSLSPAPALGPTGGVEASLLFLLSPEPVPSGSAFRRHDAPPDLFPVFLILFKLVNHFCSLVAQTRKRSGVCSSSAAPWLSASIRARHNVG